MLLYLAPGLPPNRLVSVDVPNGMLIVLITITNPPLAVLSYCYIADLGRSLDSVFHVSKFWYARQLFPRRFHGLASYHIQYLCRDYAPLETSGIHFLSLDLRLANSVLLI